MTFITALRHDAFTAPWVIDVPINGGIFNTYVEQVLVPTLRQGDIVILGNIGSHKASAIRLAIKTAGARLFFLPAYPPDPCAAKSSPLDCFLYAAHPSSRYSPNSNTLVNSSIHDFLLRRLGRGEFFDDPSLPRY